MREREFVAQGTREEIVKSKKSRTVCYLKRHLQVDQTSLNSGG